jgi:hypothetical protein
LFDVIFDLTSMFNTRYVSTPSKSRTIICLEVNHDLALRFNINHFSHVEEACNFIESSFYFLVLWRRRSISTIHKMIRRSSSMIAFGLNLFSIVVDHHILSISFETTTQSHVKAIAVVFIDSLIFEKNKST